MRRRQRMLLILIVLAASLVLAGAAAAHPLGNFTINRYSRLELSAEQIDLLYVVDMAEIPTFQERQGMDADGDGHISPTEQAAYLERKVRELVEGLNLETNGRTAAWTMLGSDLSFPPGQGDLLTLRLTLRLATDLPQREQTWRGEYQDDNFRQRLGWQEVIVRPGAGVQLLASTAPAEDLSHELRDYPQSLLQSPPAVNRASFEFAATGRVHGVEPTARLATTADSSAIAAAEIGPPGQEDLARLLDTTLDRPGAIVAALLVAAGLGAAHALTPGHGKTIVGAYLAGSRGTARHALFLGATTTVTHTAGVFAFGLIVLFASRFILPERLFPWLGVLSGLLVAAIGFSLLRQRLRRLLAARPLASEENHEGVSGYHYHLGVGHAHEVAHTARVSWRSLLALGVSGGLLPCPSALILLLSAVALQRVGYGLVLIVAFSLGLAGVLTGIGLTLVYTGRLVERVPGIGGRLWSVVPALSATFVAVAGLAITLQAIGKIGLR